MPAAIGLPAAEPSAPQNQSWKNKPLREWNEQDAKLLLADSPWVKFVVPEQVRDLSQAERRDGGDWDADTGHGVGIAGTGILGPARAAAAIARAHEKPPLDSVAVRWESALPVRVAEQKVGDPGVPLPSDDYAIAIYNIPFPSHGSARDLKRVAFLQRDRHKDLKPSHVDVTRHDDGTATLIYRFPRSVEITKKDGRVGFHAQVGRLVIAQNFFTQDMQLQGELQLLMPSN
jgi:hypothetical protein